jgi:hypothetical protein
MKKRKKGERLEDSKDRRTERRMVRGTARIAVKWLQGEGQDMGGRMVGEKPVEDGDL